jgi:hypothetical protein
MPRKQDHVVNTANPFAALASDSESEEPLVKESPPFRVWADDGEKRFKNDTNIFSSPFSRKKWSKPRFKEDGEGWVSIEAGQQDLQSMVSRGDQETAILWAEKVKKSLERSEKVRVEFKRGKDNSSNIGTRLSFFRNATIGAEK